MLSLEELETRIRSLVEVQLLKYIPGYKQEDQVVHLLAAAMQGHLVSHDGIYEAPNIYTIIARPSALVHWSRNANLLLDLANAMHEIGSEAGFYFSSRPKVTVASDLNLKPGEVRILATFSTEPIAETQDISSAGYLENNNETDTIPANAYLIQDGTKIIPLDRSVVNIGRRLTNHIIIDDPRISRSHAQLRVINGNYVLFDLESSGGTFVNGQQVSKSILNPGDVISLAGITLIYCQDAAAGHQLPEKTAPVSSLSCSNPTLVPKSEQGN